jgi:hypothetical protein
MTTRTKQRKSQAQACDLLICCSKLTCNRFALVTQLGTIGKKKAKKQSAKATLAEVTKEMAKPRVAKVVGKALPSEVEIAGEKIPVRGSGVVEKIAGEKPLRQLVFQQSSCQLAWADAR